MQVEVVGDVYNGLREEGLGGSGLGQRGGMVVCLSLRCALVSLYNMVHTYNVPQPFKILCDCNIALQLMFGNFHLFTPALG